MPHTAPHITPVNPAMAATFVPPVMAARRWLEGVEFPAERPLINVSQAAPTAPPPEPMRAAMAEAILNTPESHLYGPVMGMPELRAELAATTTRIYGAEIDADRVAITSGCNQAFAAAIATLAGKGDEIILPTPWYFNHKMWCDMQGVRVVPLPGQAGLLPDPDEAERLITPATKAIVLVTPNNPGGVEYPPAVLRAFYDLAQRRNLALILDETYRDFHSSPAAPHGLFDDPDWDNTLIQLYSFSKSFRLTGHRVGAILAGKSRLDQIEKFLDTVTICPNQIGQIGALWGLRNLGNWLASERQEVLDRAQAVRQNMPKLAQQGWQLLGLGAYFAYLHHPFALPSSKLAPALVKSAGILLMPGTMFTPDTDPRGESQLRIAFANGDAAEIATLFDRLGAVDFAPK